MRILWITPGFAADENDLNCIPPMLLLARELLTQGVDLQIITLEYPFRSDPYRWRATPPPQGAGEAVILPCNGQNRRWMKARTLWRAIRFGRDVAGGSPKIDAIHSFWLGWASGLGERLSRRYGIPHFTTLMGQDVLQQNWKFLYGLNARRVARFVAVSEYQNDIFEKNTGLRAARVIPWGVETTEIPATLPTEKSLDILGAGSLVPVKNWEKWMRVMALIVRKYPDIRGELIGDGILRRELEQLLLQSGLEKNIRFAGNLPRPEVLARMRNAKILLHTARYESFGYVLAEAAMNGCSVVGTPVGATGQFGETAESDVDLAALVVEALAHPAQNHSFVPFTMQQTTAAYLKIYNASNFPKV